MRGIYRALVRLARGVGIWVVGVFAWFVAAGYFLLLPGRRAHSLRLYRALAPERSPTQHLLWTWQQYQGFARIYSERLLLQQRPDALRITMEGLEHIEAAARQGQGAVLLMSHVGNWEIAGRILARRGVALVLLMGARPGEGVEQEQKQDLAGDGVTVIAVPEGQDDFLAGVEALQALRQGKLVSLAGDRSHSPSHARVSVRLLGQEVALPLAPHALALLARVPLIPFFALRTGRRRYHFVAYPPWRVEPTSRAERQAALRTSAQRYARVLEEVLRAHPTQFYHFGPFLPAE